MESNHEKHLEFIQGAIARMNSSSFQMKGWAITIFSALLALFASSNAQNYIYLFISGAPTILFWFLDAYYLQQERKFRRLYNDVAGLTEEQNRKAIRAYEMSICNYKKDDCAFSKCFWSVSLFPLYIFMILGAITLGVLFRIGCI